MAKAVTDVRSLARSHTEMCINVLRGIASEKKAPRAARIAASTALLDRGWGKAATILDTPDGKPLQLVERRIVYTSAEHMLQHAASETARDVTPTGEVVDASPIEEDNPRNDADAMPTTISSEAADANEPQPTDWREALTAKKARDNEGAKARVQRVRTPKSAAKPKRKATPKRPPHPPHSD